MKGILQYIIENKKLDKYITNTYPDDPIKSAVYDYVAGYTTNVNMILRKNEKWNKVTDLLDKAFTKQKEKIDVYRTVDWDYMNNIYGITKDNLDDFIGKEITNKAYMSTTHEFHSPWGNTWTSDELVLHIVSNKPYPYIDVNDMFTADEIDCEDQKEYLLPRNTTMKILSYEIKKNTKESGKIFNKNGTYLIELQIV